MVAKFDLSGQKFGRFTVLRESVEPRKRTHWECLCECGRTKVVEGTALKSGHTKSCGCIHKQAIGDRCRKDLTGQRFSRLVVIRYAGSHPKEGGSLWECKCDCGNTTVVRAGFLGSGNTKSCGCRKEETKREVGDRVRTHGRSHDSTYTVWSGMIQRCTNPKSKIYKHYGGRGITVCDRWLESFENFLEDMGERPSLEFSIERIENELGYSPSNCKWATDIEQARNRRNNRIVEYLGREYCLQELAILLGMKITTLSARLAKGWSIEKIASTPVRFQKPRG